MRLVTANTPPPPLETLCLVGDVDVALPLSPRLFSEDVLASVAANFPKALRLVEGHLVLAPVPNAHAILRDGLKQLYAAHR